MGRTFWSRFYTPATYTASVDVQQVATAVAYGGGNATAINIVHLSFG
jgi:hypothetical protein